MSKFNLRSVFSAPLIIFSPFKKLKLNGFIGGLIFGAIFSLVVNMVTVQVQEIIQRQRILEAVEYEILNNYLQSKGVVAENDLEIKKNGNPNIFHTFPLYFNDLWTQSTEPLQYIAQLDPSVQSMVTTYYSITVKGQNELVNKLSDYADKKLINCFDFSLINEAEKKLCRFNYFDILDLEASSADDMTQRSYEILKIFHPTQDRLNSFILKLFMGDKSVRFLSGK